MRFTRNSTSTPRNVGPSFHNITTNEDIRIIGTSVLFAGFLILALWIRIQGGTNIPNGQFTETDSYLYYWQAQIISEYGHLPERDMNRWLPLGRDLGQTLNLYNYVLAYTHKAVAWLFPNVTLYDVTFYMPIFCFCIAVFVLCLFLWYTRGFLFSTTVGLLLATLPGVIERSAAGFGDRDAFCLMIGILPIITYLTSLEAETPRKRLIWTLASGFFVFLGGISWEGFGVFLSVIMVVELWRFLTSETEEGLGLYTLWVCCFTPTLYLASPAYRNGYGFAEHLTAFLLLPPIVLLAMRAIRFLLLSKVDRLRLYGRTLALGVTLICVALALGYVLIQRETFADTTVPISNSAVMQAMTELKAPEGWYWLFRYGTVFIIGSLGFILIPLTFWKKQGILLSIPLTLFTITSFFRELLDKLWGEPFGNILFGTAIAGYIAMLIYMAWRRSGPMTNELVSIAFMTWFLVWVALARDAKRYDFFIGVALAYGTAALIQFIAESLSKKLRQSVYVTDVFRENFKSVTLRTFFSLTLLIFLMFLPLNYAHTYRSLYAAKKMRIARPGNTNVAKAIYWMKAELPPTAVVAAPWSYGSQINVLAGVKTITDQDTYLQNWIRLYDQHVHEATSEREVLEFLKTHTATHLMLVGYKPARTFLRGQLSDAFVPIYPKDNFTESMVNIWEIHYPSDIRTDVKYLKTGYPEIDDYLQPQ